MKTLVEVGCLEGQLGLVSEALSRFGRSEYADGGMYAKVWHIDKSFEQEFAHGSEDFSSICEKQWTYQGDA